MVNGSMKTITLIVSLVFGVVLTGQLVLSSSQNADKSVGAASPLPVEAMVLTPLTSIVRERFLSGTIVPARRVQLAFERSARLEKLLVDEGDVVTTNQRLAVLDQRQIKISLEELRARRQQQAAILAELESGPRKETIDAATADLEAMNAEVELRKTTFNRTRDLRERNAASEQTLDEVRLTFQAAVARRDSVARQLDELLSGTRVEQIVAQQAALAILDAQIRSLETDLEDSTLKAPFGGLVSRRMADDGDIPAPRQPVFELLETERLEAHIGIPAALIEQLSTDSYQVLCANEHEFTGTVRSIIPELDPVTRTQTAIIKLDKAYPANLAVGQLVRMKINETVPISGFQVPLSALSSGAKGLWNIFVIEPSNSLPSSCTARIRTVEVIHSDGKSAVIRGAVYAGEHIVATGAHRLTSDQLIVPVSEAPSSAQETAASQLAIAKTQALKDPSVLLQKGGE